MVDRLTADLHLGHRAILEHCARPFASIEEMDATLKANWAAVVKPNDTVYVLGDFAWSSSRVSVDDLLAQLPGSKVLLYGNHDSKKARRSPGWDAVHYALELRSAGRELTLCHFPWLTWERRNSGSYMCHGHWHGEWHGEGRRPRAMKDAGVDARGFAPVDVETLCPQKKAPGSGILRGRALARASARVGDVF